MPSLALPSQIQVRPPALMMSLPWPSVLKRPSAKKGPPMW